MSASQTRDKRWFSLKPVILTEVFPPVRSAEFPEYLKTMSLFQKLRFHITVNHMRDLPDTRREIAFVGRSNAGKSSALNTLANHVRLAYVSKTPGRTQHINYFSLGDDLYLVDLPGYGYAKVAISVKDKFQKLISRYVLDRENLYCLFVLIDVRHSPQKIDLEFITWLGENHIPFAIIFTKADKLGKVSVAKSVGAYTQELKKLWEELPPILVSSSLDGTGRDEILEFIDNVNKTEE